MVRISSVTRTVLPTPAPPNSPALPPRASGASRSITLIPVSSRVRAPLCWASGGGARWIGQRSGLRRNGRAAVARGAEDVHKPTEHGLANGH